MIRVLIAYGPALVWAGVVAVLGGWSDLKGPTTDLPIDKLAHFFLYGILAVLAARGWRRSERWPGRWWLILAILMLGAWDELRQREVHGRTADVTDWVADAAGTLIGFVVASGGAGEARKRRADDS